MPYIRFCKKCNKLRWQVNNNGVCKFCEDELIKSMLHSEETIKNLTPIEKNLPPARWINEPVANPFPEKKTETITDFAPKKCDLPHRKEKYDDDSIIPNTASVIGLTNHKTSHIEISSQGTYKQSGCNGIHGTSGKSVPINTYPIRHDNCCNHHHHDDDSIVDDIVVGAATAVVVDSIVDAICDKTETVETNQDDSGFDAGESGGGGSESDY